MRRTQESNASLHEAATLSVAIFLHTGDGNIIEGVAMACHAVQASMEPQAECHPLFPHIWSAGQCAWFSCELSNINQVLASRRMPLLDPQTVRCLTDRTFARACELIHGLADPGMPHPVRTLQTRLRRTWLGFPRALREESAWQQVPNYAASPAGLVVQARVLRHHAEVSGPVPHAAPLPAAVLPPPLGLIATQPRSQAQGIQEESFQPLRKQPRTWGAALSQWCPACAGAAQASIQSWLTAEGRHEVARGRHACGASWTLSRLPPPYGSGVQLNLWHRLASGAVLPTSGTDAETHFLAAGIAWPLPHCWICGERLQIEFVAATAAPAFVPLQLRCCRCCTVGLGGLRSSGANCNLSCVVRQSEVLAAGPDASADAGAVERMRGNVGATSA